jgi:hypothetical protein
MPSVEFLVPFNRVCYRSGSLLFQVQKHMKLPIVLSELAAVVAFLVPLVSVTAVKFCFI